MFRARCCKGQASKLKDALSDSTCGIPTVPPYPSGLHDSVFNQLGQVCQTEAQYSGAPTGQRYSARCPLVTSASWAGPAPRSRSHRRQTWSTDQRSWGFRLGLWSSSTAPYSWSFLRFEAMEIGSRHRPTPAYRTMNVVGQKTLQWSGKRGPRAKRPFLLVVTASILHCSTSNGCPIKAYK